MSQSYKISSLEYARKNGRLKGIPVYLRFREFDSGQPLAFAAETVTGDMTYFFKATAVKQPGRKIRDFKVAKEIPVLLKVFMNEDGLFSQFGYGRSEARTEVMEAEAKPEEMEVAVVGESLPAKLVGAVQSDKHWKAPKRRLPTELKGAMEPTLFPGDDPNDPMYFHAMHSASHNPDGLGATPSLQEAMGKLDILRDLFGEAIPVEGIPNGVRFLKMPETRPNEFVVFPDAAAKLPQVMTPTAFKYMAAIKRALEESGEYLAIVGFDSMLAGAEFRQLYFKVILIPVERGLSRIDKAKTKKLQACTGVRLSSNDYRAKAMVFSERIFKPFNRRH
jgi:hypothetical protein